MAKAKETLDYLKCSEEERQAFEAYKESLHYQASMYESTYVSGRMDGIEEGEKRAMLQMAKKMLQKNSDVELIMELTGLTQVEIESLRLN